jgi:nucleotide-binding universal stress UspA family protein
MVWRDVLTFVDASEDGIARLNMAYDVAKKLNARLDAHVVVRLPSPAYGPGSEAMLEIYEDVVADYRKQGADAVAALRTSVVGDTKAVALHAAEALASEVRAMAARMARTSDLVVVGQPEDIDRSDIDTDVLVGALLGGGRPCLMLPRWIKPHVWGRRALIAWKGTPESARAVQGALPFLRDAEKVRICVANPRTEREGEDERGVARLASYLLHHGVPVEEPVIAQSWEGAERLIFSEIEGFNADLVVMGAYSRPRFQEIIFGGMTAAMIREAKTAVLMAH